MVFIKMCGTLNIVQNHQQQVSRIMTIVAIKNSPRPSKAHRVDTIVESARKIFCSYGFENGSIGNIAKDAGIAEGTIYSYFDSKRTLLDEVLRRHYFALFNDIEQTLPSIQGPANRLRYLIRRTLITILDDRGMSRLRSLYARQADSERPSLARDQNRRMAGMMANEIRAGIKDGSFRSDTSPNITCYMIGGAIELTEFSYVQNGEVVNLDEIAESIWRTISGGISSTGATKESLIGLVERFEQAADRLDPR